MHEIVGSMYFSIKELVKMGEQEDENSKYFWQNLYGAPKDYSKEAALAMNENPEIATQWKGMFLMHVNVRTVENPERCVKQL